ncbi:heavy metal P-type ATPase [Medicago truncatula]|uniref:P-type Cu(+) transporter n=1 Tax=Medicago truncatula TaxID=3880 RepID=A0A072TTK1_MEDTR|nr:heavy metal P-type ATPase [Medicago truncatula]
MGRKKFDGAWECINGGLHLRCCGNLSPESHYPSMTTYPKGTSSSMGEGSEVAITVVFCVMGMTCAACAGSVEKAIKRLPGIREAVVDVLNDKAQVLYLPTIVNEESIRDAIEDAGFEAKSMEDDSSNNTSFQICRVHIGGMTCTSCSSNVQSVLQSLRGVQIAQVALATEEAEIRYDPKIISYTQLMETISNTGFNPILISKGEHISKIELKIDGIKNEQSMYIIEQSLRTLQGVETIETYLDINKIVLTYKPYMTGPRTFIELIESSGSGCFRATIFPNDGGRKAHKQEEINRYFKLLIWSLVFTVPVFLTSMVLMYIPGVKNVLEVKIVNMLNIGLLIRWEFSTPVQFVIGRRFYVGAYKALSKGYANMDLLIALGTNAAYFYSVYVVGRATFSSHFEGSDFFETSSMLISFILLGKYLEVLAKGKTSQAIAKLMDLTPDTATLLTLDDDKGNVLGEREIDSRLIQKNDVIKVVPGTKVASDGFVVWGQSHVNESMITGEAKPVAKMKGDMVIGGTVNENGVLHVKVTRIGSETALSQIVRLVESAQMAKAPVQKYADQISKYFVPIVIVLSLSTWISWFVAGKLHSYPKSWIPSSMNSFELALQFGISVMVIACPCALGLATPTAVMVGTGVGATQGVLIKGGQALESAHKVNCIVFDKTGTLTIGKPVVVTTKLFKNMPVKDFYELVAAAEVNSEHPIAKSIVDHAKNITQDEQNNPSWPQAKEFVSIAGHGVKAIVQNKEIMVGNKKLMLDHNIAISVEAEEILAEAENMAQTGILVSLDGEIVGVLAVSDPLKPDAKEVISILKSMKIKSIMVTGDNWGTANSIARQAGIETVMAEAQPETKAIKVKELQVHTKLWSPITKLLLHSFRVCLDGGMF